MSADAPALQEELSRSAQAAQDRGDLPEAIALRRQLAEAGPAAVAPWLRLGALYLESSQHGLAMDAFEKARALEPGNGDVLCMLGATLSDLGRHAEAAAQFKLAVQAQPAIPELHFNLALAQFEQADFTGADASLARAHALRRGAPWGPDPLRALAEPRAPLSDHDLGINTVKIQHDAEQFEHLLRRGRLPREFHEVLDEYRALQRELATHADPSALCAFDAAAAPLVAATYKRPLHLAMPLPAGPLLNPALDARRLEDEYQGSKPNVVVVDDFLSPAALAALREFCQDSTIWNNPQAEYLGAYFYDGFRSEFLLRLAWELRECLPGVIRQHALQMMWGYKYGSRLGGIGLHADMAAVNVNFWITDSAANEDPARGGLVIYPHDAPPEWGFTKFNRDAASIRGYLESVGSQPIRVPYRANRAVIFDSDLFHATDTLRFREGYLNRRVNITFLYGLRRPPVP